MKNHLLAEVCLPLALHHPLTYLAPEEFEEKLSVGHRVLVPLGNRRITGYAVELKTGPVSKQTKAIIEIVDEQPLFPLSMVPFFEWVAKYYHYPLGMVIKTALPAGMNFKGNSIYELIQNYSSGQEEFTGDMVEQIILEKLAQQRSLPTQWKGGGFSKEECEAGFIALEKKGAVRKKIHFSQRGIKARHVKVVSLQPIGDKEQTVLPLRQGEVVQFLEQNKTATLPEISHSINGAAQAVRALEKKGVVTVTIQRIHRTPIGDDVLLGSDPPQLTPDQQEAVHNINKALDSNCFKSFLLHGVTGSGKTEVYLRTIEYAISLGRSALVLVPEITLSLSMEGIFRARFGNKMSIIHSGLRRGEAYDQWSELVMGKSLIAIGARSAVFSPLDSPGLIVVDEEHDPSYKQEDHLRYNARDLALIRGKMSKSVVILGSATPSVNTYNNAVRGKVGYISLPKRVNDRPMPEVEIVDMRKERGGGFFSAQLISAVRETLEKEEQTLLFLNRRGYSPVILCPRCGETVECPHCQVSLTYHRSRERLACHYCGHSQKMPKVCQACGAPSLFPLGIGTERLEKEIRSFFPKARIARLDSDVAPKRRELFQLLKDLRQGDIDILIGTQMITKGHDFPNVTLVGVLAADHSLHFPDFNSTERTFQLLTQVSGRAGRGSKKGKVIAQTYNPDHYSIVHAKGHVFHPFYLKEIVNRFEFRYPPFSRMVSFPVSGKDPQATRQMAEFVGEAVKNGLNQTEQWGRVLGPAPAPIHRLKDKYRWNVLLMCNSVSMLNKIVFAVMDNVSRKTKGSAVTVSVDVDPVTIR